MVFVSMSADESCNLPMVEANACGIPAVVFDCRGDYTDHCEYIKYGIVVNLNVSNKVSNEDMSRFQMAMEWISHYHFCSRVLKITAMIPLIPHTKFYDFPMSLAEYHHYLDDKKIKNGKKIKKVITTKQWHLNAFRYCFKEELPKWN